jgi:tRNA 2-selenouridine synthase
MSQHVPIGDFLEKKGKAPVVDVRSPSEYEKGHIPGAYNIPLFSDSERADVGKEYKRHGPPRAILMGLKIVRPKLKEYVSQAKEISPNLSLLVHCWRGGMRSANMALLFRIAGLDCEILDGGYQSYRRFLKDTFRQERKITILGGYTGSGKTEILKKLPALGEQIIDLEGMAHHKGSAFGALGQEAQPTNEQFENNLFEKWRQLDPDVTVWIEDESKAIGSVFIPDDLFSQMRKSPVIKIDMDVAMRTKRLENEYANFPPEVLKRSIEKIGKRLGDKNRRIAMHAIDQGNFSKAIHLSLSYYDKSYRYGLSRRPSQNVHAVHIASDQAEDIAQTLIQHTKRLNLHSTGYESQNG